MKVKVQVSEVVPESGRTVEEVERGFYESQEVKEKTEEVGQMLDGQRDGMKVKDIGHESISYTMACQSLDALECLMRKYENGKIQDLMEDEFLSDKLLDKIGAYYLAIDVTIDYEEYLMCRKELIQMYGEPVNDGQQERDIQSMGESHESETSQEKIDGSARRVNRARYLLKSFEKEGGKVTENQINMLDQLLKEKEEKRQLVHKRSLQASWVEEIVHGEHIQRGSSGILRLHDSDLHQLTEDQITELNEGLKSEIAKQTHDGRVARAMHRERGRGRDILRSSLVEGKKVTEREFNPLFSEFIQVKTDMRELETNRPEATIKNEKLLADVEAIVQDADIAEEMKELYIEKRRIDKGIPIQNTVRKISRYGNGPGEVCRPWALVINKNGEVVVCDKGPDEGPVDQPGSVKTIAPDTAQVLSIITFHCLPETFRPTGVAIDDQGVYYIADDGNQCIVVCDALGKFEQTIDLGEVSSPEICLGQGNDIFVADYNGHVMKYNKSGQKIATRELTSPWSPTMNSKNQLLVSGSSDGCVYVLDDDLKILYTFGEEELTEPMGLSVDAMGENVYVANYSSVAVFSAQGEHLKYVKVEGIPEKLAVFADGRIVYVDSSDSNELCLKVI
ncbi:uncharacterized protein [Ptychodera flava]|uniref:uncharacterized protein n=1 Tax=Ptychodera flava TaxID=63121 RepID=UPI00396A4FEE